MRIIHKLLLAFFSIALLMGVAGYIAVQHSERVLIDTIGSESVEKAAALMYEVDEGIFDRIEFLQIYAQQQDLVRAAMRSNKIFDKYTNPQDYINAIDRDWKAKLTTPPINAVLNSPLSVQFAKLIASYKKKYGYRVFTEIELTNRYGVIIAAWPRTSDYLQADEQWYQQAKAEEKFWVGEVEYDESSDSIGADIVINLYDDAGNHAGVLKAVINIIDVIKSLQDYQLTEHHKDTNIKLITSKGELLYSSESSENKNEKLMQLLSQSILSGFKKNISGSGYFIRENDQENNPDELLAKTTSIGYRDYKSSGWSIILAHKKDELLQPVIELNNQFTVLLSLTIFLTGLLSFFVARSLSRPLERLGEASIAIGKGQLDTRLDITSKDEMGSLSTLINEMVESLQRTTVSKSYLNKIVESIMDSMVVISPEGVIAKVNSTTLNLLGYDEQELLGQPITSIFAEEEEESLLLNNQGIAEIVDKGSVRNIEKTYLTKERVKIPVLFSAAVMRDNGEAQGIVCASLDITERKQAEQELHEKSHDLAERVKELDCYFSLSQIIRIPNLSEKELFERTVNIIPPGWQYSDITCARINFDGNTYTSQGFKETSWKQTTCINLYGEWRGEVEVFYMEECPESDEGPFLNEERTLIDHIALLLAETTMKMDADNQLRESEEKNRLILESTSDGIYAVDLEGVCTICNRSAVNMLGYNSAADIRGKDTHSLFHSKRQDGSAYPKEECSLLSNHEKNIVIDDEYFWRADGNGFPVQCRLAPIFHDDEIIGNVISFTDMTELHNTELKLRQAQKLESIGQLAAGIAHEINTPTQFVNDNTSFLGDAFEDYKELMEAYEHIRHILPSGEVSESMLKAVDELAEEKDIEFLNEEIPQAIKQSQDGLERIGKIVMAMKEFSHPGVEEKTPIDIGKAIETTINVSRNEWKYYCDIKTDFDPDLPLVPCLPGEINQVFLNLIVNASHAIADVVGKSGEMGVIQITTRQDGDWAEIAVSDTGCGIPEEIQKRIFDPFFTTKEVGKGSGQGLAIVYSAVVDKLSGTIDVESKEGKGTTFNIRLPISQDTV